MNITILDNRDVIINSSDNLGTQNENNASIINFSFPESLMNANKKIVFITDDGNYWDLITNNSYKITNAVSKYKNVSVYVWLVDEQNDIDFRSKIWNVSFNKNEEPDDIVPTEEEISGFDTMITQLNQGLEDLDEEKIKLRREYEKVEEGLEDLDEALIQVNNVDIDVSKSGNTSTITITNKEGVEKSVQIEDGTDYVITQEDYQAIANVVEEDITPLIPTKTSDLNNDSGFIDNTVNNLTNYYDKTTSDGKYALITETGYRVELSVDNSTYVMTLNLKNKSGNILNTQTVDLPLETMVVNASYDSLTKEIVLTLQNGNTVRFSVADLVSGLQAEITSSNKLASDLVDDTNQTNKFVTTSEKTTWNAKYVKPSGGIPKTDLSSAVQTSLEKADSALQEHQDISGKEDKTNKVTSLDDESTNTQYPSAKLLYDKLEEKQEQIDGLVTENALLKDQIPNGTAEGTNVQITDSSNLLIEDGVIKGYTSQVQYEGYNKFDPSNFVNKNNVSITNEGIISSTGISTNAWSYSNHNWHGILPAGTYKLSVFFSTIESNQYAGIQVYNSTGTQLTNFDYLNNVSQKTKTLTLTEETEIGIQFKLSNGICTFQIEPGSTAHDWEPYVGGTASPNPNYEQTVHRVTGDCEVEVVSKNLLSPPSSNGTVTNIGMTFSCNKNNEYHLRGTSTSTGNVIINYSLENDYVIQENDYLHLFNDTIPTGTIQIVGVSPKGQIFVSTITSVGKIINLSAYAGKIIHYFFVFCLEGASANMTMTPMIINNISTATTYTPHAEQNAPLTLGNIELCKIGNYQDYLFKNVRTLRSGRVNPLFNADLDEGDWYKYEAIGEKIFNNNDTFYSVSEGYYINFNAKATTPKNILCNLYVNKLTYSTFMASDYAISLLYSANQLYIRDKDVSSANELLTKLINNNGKVVYIKETPTYTKITDTTLIAQLEAYYNSSTYRNVTNIITAGEDLAPIAGIVYKKDLTTLFNKLDSLEARVDLLEE